jgi:peptide/nickel transport system permease protein
VAGSLLAVLLLPSLLPLDAYSADLRAVLQAPGLSHILGTDENGRDVLARLLVGGRGTLGIALLATLLAVLLGVVVGGIAGYRGGVLDALLMRGVDLALAFPSLFAILLVAAILPAGSLLLIGLIGATGWMATARLVRARVQTLLGTAYVEAARALGVPDHQVLWRHLVPNLFGLLVVSGLVQFSRSILAEATISFLGFGIQPPAPTWGNLLMGAQNYVYTAPWLAIAPGLAITGTLLAVSALGVGGPAGRHRHPVTAPSHEHAHDESGTFAVKRSVSEGRDSLSPARR